MTNAPLVSAITIFLNGGKYLEEAIESVLAQSYRHWELWLVDDGSTDGSSDLARQYADRYPDTIRYLEHAGHRNRGMSASRNLALHHARGEYIAFLDADDIWLPHKLEQQVAVMEADPRVGMVYGPTYYWYDWSGHPLDTERDYLKSLGVPADRLYQPPELLIQLLHNPGAIPGNCSLLARASMVEHVDGFEDSFTGIYEDQVFFAKACLAAPVFVTSTCVARYRQHEDSSCVIAERQGIYHRKHPNQTRQLFLDWLEAYLRTHDIGDARLWRALRRQLLPYRQPVLYRLTRIKPAGLRLLKQATKRAARRLLPATVYSRLVTLRRGREYVPPVGGVRFGSFQRLSPIDRNFGYNRGQPVDRYYIESFLAHEARAIRGRVLEIGDAAYTRRFGGPRVAASDVLHVTASLPEATFVGDLADAPHLPSAAFDCVILTQTLQFIYDTRAALDALYRILKPGGVVLVTLPGISHIADQTWRDTWYWNFTTHSALRMFADVFDAGNVTVGAHGNVLAATAFLQGLAVEELDPADLDHSDPDYQVLITVKAIKRETAVCAE